MINSLFYCYIYKLNIKKLCIYNLITFYNFLGELIPAQFFGVATFSVFVCDCLRWLLTIGRPLGIAGGRKLPATFSRRRPPPTAILDTGQSFRHFCCLAVPFRVVHWLQDLLFSFVSFSVFYIFPRDERFTVEEHYEWLKEYSHFQHLIRPYICTKQSVCSFIYFLFNPLILLFFSFSCIYIASTG